jgi:peptide methionine sulfoxide reductase MsrB
MTPGLYVDIVSGKPLFSSLENFDNDGGCCSSFTKPVAKENTVALRDESHRMLGPK